MRFSEKVIEVLNFIETNILKHYSAEDVQLFYGDYRRRVELLSDMLHLTPEGAKVLDAGSAPCFNSLALSLLGYEVYSLGINPEPYRATLEKYEVKVIKADFENEVIPLEDGYIDCIMLAEVLEHLHPYKIPFTLSEMPRVLRVGGILYLTTPNAVSIGKRIKMLFGLQPVGERYVREYMIKEVITLSNSLS